MGVVEADVDFVFANERVRSARSVLSVYAVRAVEVRDGVRRVVAEYSPPDDERADLFGGFQRAPDGALWHVGGGNVVRRFHAGGAMDWERRFYDSVRVIGLSVEGAALGLLYDIGRARQVLGRIGADGRLEWAIDLVRSDGITADAAWWVPSATAPDGVVYVTVAGQLVAVQTDFAPRR